jgi:hypothetical protein
LAGMHGRKKKGEGRSREEDSLLERVTAAEERRLSHNSLIANRRTWLKIIWAAAEGLGLETFPVERGVLEEATRGRSGGFCSQEDFGPD